MSKGKGNTRPLLSEEDRELLGFVRMSMRDDRARSRDVGDWGPKFDRAEVLLARLLGESK